MGRCTSPLCNAALANPARQQHRRESDVHGAPSYDSPFAGQLGDRRYVFHWRDGQLAEALRLGPVARLSEPHFFQPFSGKACYNL